MKKILTIIILFSYFTCLHANEYDICKGIIIDDVTEKAYGQHGLLYTGEAICYWDPEKTILKSKRTYDNGIPVGRHVCYEKDGVPDYSISYNHTKIRNYSFNYSDARLKKFVSGVKIDCIQGEDGACWSGWACKPNDAQCTFTCN